MYPCQAASPVTHSQERVGQVIEYPSRGKQNKEAGHILGSAARWLRTWALEADCLGWKAPEPLTSRVTWGEQRHLPGPLVPEL